ncbi:MAG: tetratricopeptide repeat protein [Verrucomicrobiae bacterium]|nr:tetratricopeptide repeat protein [Verrucomicrobiae bacterium]
MSTESSIISPASPPLFDLFWEEYRQKILLAIVGFLFLLLATGGILLLRHSRRLASESLLAQSADITSWQKVISSYPGSGAAANAMLLIAATQRQAHDVPASNNTYAQFLEKFPHHPLAISAMIGRALNDDVAGHSDQALDELQQASVAYPQSYGAPFALWMRARLLTRMGKTEDSKKTMQMISTQYPDSFVNNMLLRQRMGQLPR